MHGAGEFQRGRYDDLPPSCIIFPSSILYSDEYKAGINPPQIAIPLASKHCGRNQNRGKDEDANRRERP